MLGEFVELMGVEHRDSVGDLIFYSDVATGEYLTETQMLHFVMKHKTDQPKAQSKQQRATALKKIPYSSFYTRQIVTRYQTLNLIMNKVRNKQNMHLERFRVVQSNPTRQPHLPIANELKI
ncbi:hypothetical protein M8J77_017698 [Diaphorina citri]|nr:hypothetical protein M8J77_017698 [Diaphorina citri]